MHLLNDSKASPLDLPPIQAFSFGGPNHGLSLPPLDLDGPPRADSGAAKPPPPQIPPLYSLTGEDGLPRHGASKEGAHADDGPARPRKSNLSLSRLLDEPETVELSHSLRMILDDTPESVDDLSSKKRQRALTGKEELIQLPQPLKKQKSSQQVIPRQPVVPPIINGLHEPPPNAAVLPPIASADFDDNEPLNLGTLKDFGTFLHEAPGSSQADADKLTATKVKRRAAKPRRKWSEEETNHLLLGVSRHGVGKWTTILEDPDFRFNDRTAGDLKDRFRTCCPDELRGKLGVKQAAQGKTPPGSTPPKLKSKSSLPLEDLLIDVDEPERDKAAPPSSQQEADATPKQKKSRAHRKKIQDLEELGIRGPFKKSHRRERRPFTEQDDKEILDGLDQYGPAWTKIQRDARFNLSSRQPTDLRDRVRNKYPEIYARIEKGNTELKDGRGNGPLEPSVNITIENSLTSAKTAPLEPTLNRSNSKEDMPRWPLPSSLIDIPDPHQLDFNEHSATGLLGNVGEMDISRLLLDDSQLAAAES